MPQTLTRLIVRSRSEETAEDVRARIYAIQENEIDQQRELTNFLDLELNFAEQYVEVLRDVKMNWVEEYVSLGISPSSHILIRWLAQLQRLETRPSAPHRAYAQLRPLSRA